MKKYFKIAWFVAFAVWAITFTVMSIIIYANMCQTGYVFTYMNWVRSLWNEINMILPAYKYVTFGCIFFLVTMFFTLNDSSEEKSC